MSHVVVLGAGLGGTIMASEMTEKMRPEDRLIVGNLGASHSFVPSDPWIAVGWRKREDITVDLTPVLAKRGIALRPEVRQGKAETFYENLTLDLLGIKNLKDIHIEPAE